MSLSLAGTCLPWLARNPLQHYLPSKSPGSSGTFDISLEIPRPLPQDPQGKTLATSSLLLLAPLSSPLNRARVSAFSFASRAALWLSAFLTKFLRNLVLGFGALLSRLVAVREDPDRLASASLRRREMIWSSSIRGVSMTVAFVASNQSS